jgi:hypothetical protein
VKKTGCFKLCFFKWGNLYRYVAYTYVMLLLGCMVGLYNLNPVDPQLESAWFQPLNLKCDILVSKICFSNSTCTTTAWPGRAWTRWGGTS